MVDINTLSVPAHFLAFSSLLGMELYQSFIMTKLAYLHLPLPQFRSLQKKVFPVYFRTQSLLVLGTLATYPWFFIQPLSQVSKVHAATFGVALGTSLLNTLVYGPKTKKVMMEKVHQETRDSKTTGYGTTDKTVSEEMKKINRRFSRNHAMSIHLNFITVLATIVYGVAFAGKIQLS